MVEAYFAPLGASELRSSQPRPDAGLRVVIVIGAEHVEIERRSAAQTFLKTAAAVLADVRTRLVVWARRLTATSDGLIERVETAANTGL